MSPGNVFFLVFGPGYLRVYNAAGANVFSSTVKGDGASAIPWTSLTVSKVSFAVAAGSQLSIYIAYADGAPNNVPQVLTWYGVSQTSTWTLATYAETVHGSGQKRTIFSRVSPQNITMLPSGTSGAIQIQFSAPVLSAGMVGTRMSFCGRQILITSVTNSELGSAYCEEPLPGGQALPAYAGPNLPSLFNIGDEVKGSISGAVGIVRGYEYYGAFSYLSVQLIPTSSGAIVGFNNGTYDKVFGDVVAGPSGSMTITPGGAGQPALHRVLRGLPGGAARRQAHAFRPRVHGGRDGWRSDHLYPMVAPYNPLRSSPRS